jgi:hypothetical protein
LILDFLDDLSSVLLYDTAAHKYPDVMAFALWCRKSTLTRQRVSYADYNVHLGRGLVFHVSPANIPIMFAYTLAVGLLSGNSNIVRLPSKPFPQVECLCECIDSLIQLQPHRTLYDYIVCIRYDREETDITNFLSQLCDVRVIWGGDNTVSEIRKYPLQPGAFDVVFPDRYSIVVINSDAWLKCEDKKRYIQGFYNDTYLSNQTSCSSPRLVLWLGGQMDAARSSFWGLLEELVNERHQDLPLQTVIKLEYSYSILARHPKSNLCFENPRITRIWCDNLEADLLKEHPGGGVFVESGARNVEALVPLLRRQCQTISYYGVPVNDLVSLVRQSGTRGGDRIVPMGDTLEFSLTWDGYDTIRTLSRQLEFATTPPVGD